MLCSHLHTFQGCMSLLRYLEVLITTRAPPQSKHVKTIRNKLKVSLRELGSALVYLVERGKGSMLCRYFVFGFNSKLGDVVTCFVCQ